MGEFFRRMLTENGGISSKRVVGSAAYIGVVIITGILAFKNPDFKNLDEILTTVLWTAAALLGVSIIPKIGKGGGPKPPISMDEK